MIDVKKGYRYLHVKSGHVVLVKDFARLQTQFRGEDQPLCDMETMVIYQHDGTLWARSLTEFSDGRFVDQP